MNQYFTLQVLRMDISFARPKDGETLHTSWTRFRKMLRRCPLCSFSSSQQAQIFYNGVDIFVRSMLDTTTNCSLYRKIQQVSLEIIVNMAGNNSGWPDIKRGKRLESLRWMF